MLNATILAAVDTLKDPNGSRVLPGSDSLDMIQREMLRASRSSVGV